MSFMLTSPRLALVAIILSCPSWLSSLTAQGPQSARLLMDVNQQPLPNPGSNPRGFTEAGSRVFFTARNAAGRFEIYATDLQGRGATQASILHTGPFASRRIPTNFHALGQSLLFSVWLDNRAPSSGLWIADGTSAGAIQLLPPTADYTKVMGTLGNTAILERGNDLWRTNGSLVSTTLVSQQFTQINNSTAIHGSHLYFAADDGVNGVELWRTDGTAAGTTMVVDLYGSVGSNPSRLTSIGNRLIFTCMAQASGELWSTDGTSAGTTRIHTTGGYSITAVGNRAVFNTIDLAHGDELWSTDGTRAGTSLLLDIKPGANGSRPSPLHTNGNRAYFTADNGTHGRELWTTDGTSIGTIRLTDLGVGPLGGGIEDISTSSQQTFFTRATGTGTATSVELWKTDGKPSGTTMVEPNLAGPTSLPSTGTQLTTIGARAFLAAGDHREVEPWTATSTPNSKSIIADIAQAPTGHTQANPGTVARGVTDDYALLVMDDGIFGKELWLSRGTPTNTTLMREFTPGPASTTFSNLETFADGTYFGTETNRSTLWRSNGTRVGTVAIAQTATHGFGTIMRIYEHALGDKRFFVATGKVPSKLDLWRTDGTANGTRKLYTGVSSLPMDGATASKIYVRASYGGVVETDGTLAGTRLVVPVTEHASLFQAIWGGMLVQTNGNMGRHNWFFGGQITNPAIPVGSLARAGDLLFGLDNSELTVSDGNSTQLVRTFTFMPGYAAALGSSLVFYADDGINGLEIWSSDGTPQGTQRISQIQPGPLGILGPEAFTELRDEAIFWAEDVAHGREPWITDGTAAGTRLLTDVTPGTTGSTNNTTLPPIATTHRLINVHTPSMGNEPWITDGTTAGSRFIGDINPGPISSTYSFIPIEHVLVNGKLLFFADNGTHGNEPWIYELGASAQIIGQACATAFEPVELRASKPQLGAVLELDVVNIPQNIGGLVFIGLPAQQPQPLRTGCFLHMDLQSMGILSFIPPTTSGTWSQQLPLPNLAALNGLGVILRPFVTPTTHSLGGDLGAPVLLKLGR